MEINNRQLGFFALSIFTLVILISFVSAATIFSDNFDDGDLSGWTASNWSNSGTHANSSSKTNATLETTISTFEHENITVNYERQLGSDWESSDYFIALWSIDGTNYNKLEEVTGVSGPDGAPGETAFVSKTFALPDSAKNNTGFRLKFECTTSSQDEFCRVDNISVEGTKIPEVVSEEPEEILSCQAMGNPGELEIKSIDITNNGIPYSEFGEDDNNWFPFEEIEVNIEVKNDGKYDVDDVSIEWGVWDIENKDWLIDIDEEKDVNIKDGDKESFTVTFKLDDDLDLNLDDFSDNSDNYRIYVRAEGTIDDRDAGSLDGKDTCASDFEASTILIEDFVILDNLNVPEVVSCGESLQITADVWNIGDRDQDEVKVNVYGRESVLDFDETFEIGDLNGFDNERLQFNLNIPKEGLENKFYSLIFEVLDEDNDIFENSDDDLARFTVPFEVIACKKPIDFVKISAVLDSDAVEGKPLRIKATILNSGDNSGLFTLEATGHTSWANSVIIDQPTLLLDSGESRDVIFTFEVKDNARGTQEFSIELTSEGETIKQPVQVTVSPSSLFGITGAAIGGGGYLWALGIVNIVLVIIIIIVAVKVARK